MKTPAFVVLCLFSSSAIACASSHESGSEQGVGAVRADQPQCQSTALDAATYVDVLGWGAVKSEPLSIATQTLDPALKTEQYGVKSTVSATTYAVALHQDSLSHKCVVDNVVGGERDPITGQDADIQCESTALDATTHVDALGWGALKSKPLKVVSRMRDSVGMAEEFKVASTVSGYTYTVEIRQDPQSESCVILSLTSEVSSQPSTPSN
jgi:hypothetical protein